MGDFVADLIFLIGQTLETAEVPCGDVAEVERQKVEITQRTHDIDPMFPEQDSEATICFLDRTATAAMLRRETKPLTQGERRVLERMRTADYRCGTYLRGAKMNYSRPPSVS